ncbi:acyl carrier protein [Chromobacterium phragmitis]|uniref:Acyl carrier protein n=1 Tax=Chromobacterium phragmitis TaxID=2202141 RepID=A0A344UDM6_9NEIS|nr:acyl carrier protein [Chromobacterium phragmitis]AXE31985.1 acyl carrier protein [Chromobacterium phragmitis]AXE33374.1 acyl carrier protein [Chromobacterium phragmitis]
MMDAVEKQIFPVEARVLAVMAATLGADVESMRPQASLVDELYADSLELLDMVMALNDAFGIEIGADDIAGIRTVGDVCSAVRQRLAA